MANDQPRHEAATSPDLSRPVAASDDNEYSLSIEEALTRYEAAGLPRTARSVQRYCAKADLDAHRIETPFGDKFLITPASVDRHIAYIKEVRLVATGRDMPRPVATDVARQNRAEDKAGTAATSADNQRQATTAEHLSEPVAAKPEMLSRYIGRLEGENDFLRKQVAIKDEQIGAFIERDRETNLLINGLQRMLGPLLPGSDRERQPPAGDHH